MYIIDSKTLRIKNLFGFGLKLLITFFCRAGRMKNSILLLFSFLLVFPICNVEAQKATSSAQVTTPPAATPTPSPTPVPDFHDSVIVKEVYNLQYEKREKPDGKKLREAALNDVIVIKVENLEALVKASECKAPYDAKPCQKRAIVLFINGREIKGLLPESGAPKLGEAIPNTSPTPAVAGSENKLVQWSSDGELRYHLKRVTDNEETSEDNDEHWADLLGLRFDRFDLKSWTRPVEISVGLAGDYPVFSEAKIDSNQEFRLIRVRPVWFAVWAGISILIVIGLIILGIKSDVLRDRAPILYKQGRKPYSLSAFQAAWWFVIIFLSFIFIWLVTGQYDFSSTALILLSIGLGTTLGGNIIDANKRNAVADNMPAGSDNLKLLLSEKEKLEADLARLENAKPVDQTAVDAKKTDYEKLVLDIKTKFPNAIGPAHKSFHMDIISDINGVSFHRFQMLVWTLILSGFFVISALGRLAMPQFTDTLLALMGISAGTFLAFKIPENNTAPIQPTTPPANSDGDGGSSSAEGKIAKIEITPASVSLSEASPTQQLSATATDAQNNPIAPGGFSPQWSSDDASVATVDQTGLITWVKVGNCNVTAMANGVTSINCVVTCG